MTRSSFAWRSARSDVNDAIASSCRPVFTSDVVLDAATIPFDALGASASGGKRGLDRCWRNARTIIPRNPRIDRQRGAGAEANAAEPRRLETVE